jgi:hypothetical protein
VWQSSRRACGAAVRSQSATLGPHSRVVAQYSADLAVTLQLREIQAKGLGVDGKRFKLRLWTTLLDPVRYPAEALARHYAERWEHALYYREFEVGCTQCTDPGQPHAGDPLQTVSAAVLASAVLARLRVAAADQLKLPAGRMSFFKMMLATQQLWNTLEFIGGQLSQAQRDQVWEKHMDAVRHTAVLQERRERSCPRVLPQPVRSWPRKTNQRSRTGQVEIKVVRV